MKIINSQLLVFSLFFVFVAGFAHAQQATVSPSVKQNQNISQLINQLRSVEVILAKITGEYASQTTENSVSLTLIHEAVDDISSTLSDLPPTSTWNEMPVGSVCGIYIQLRGSVRADIECQGHSARTSCPVGYERADLGYFEAYSGDRKFAYCVKTDPTGNEMSWDDAPSGALCGVNMMTRGKLRARVECQGHVPGTSCPNGFSLANFGYIEAGGGTRYSYLCIKD